MPTTARLLDTAPGKDADEVERRRWLRDVFQSWPHAETCRRDALRALGDGDAPRAARILGTDRIGDALEMADAVVASRRAFIFGLGFDTGRDCAEVATRLHAVA